MATMPALVLADSLTFSGDDFSLNPTFSNVWRFSFYIDLAVPVSAGSVYSNPALNGVEYRVSGSLSETPSGFQAFNLIRSIAGPEFYTQGSTLSFEVKAGADLSDGLQVSELVGSDIVFEFDGREVGTGRYHPALVQLKADGTGSIYNSNNTGGVNPMTKMEVDVEYGEEYITELVFDPISLTLFFTNAETECAEDEHVSAHNCVVCPPGTTNAAGDDASGEDTSCNVNLILQDGFETG